eukprot:m.246249 g.246249  ORF g.246249 m.246249 type:complete len:395 (-) comp33847_c0_seq6:97-1281(-)
MSTQLDEQDSTSEEEDFALDTDTTDSTQTMYEASPFNHQVGGHGPVVMLIGTNFVAKPLDAKKKEQRFYQEAPNALLPFVPAFHGLAPVKFASDAIKTVFRQKKTSDDEIDSGNAAVSATCYTLLDPHVKDKNVVVVEEDAPHETLDGRDDHDHDHADALDHTNCKHSLNKSVNPWSIEMFRKQLATEKHAGIVNCILLENLAGKFRYPCILDVKIGTRSWDDSMDAKKKAKHKAKANSTTTATLGFRICGSQVYSQEMKKFLCHDKYYGRTLTTSTISDSLREYFELNTGKNPRVCGRGKKTILALVKRLGELKQVVEAQKGFRFYSSSLLLLYEGDVNASDAQIDVRIIDFAHTSACKDNCDLEDSSIPDTGFLFGLDNLSNRLKALIVDNP